MKKPFLNTVNRYVGYYRVSTHKQGHSGLGLDAQQASLQNYINSQGGAIETEFTEIESGTLNQRPELEKAIEYCKKHKATLLIAKLDRLSRNLHFITGLMESKIDFVAADNPHANKLMIHMLAAFAEHEREVISERTRYALRAAKERGAVLGKNGRILAKQNRRNANEFAQKLAPVIHDIKRSGCKTIQSICDQLNERGIPAMRGGRFYVGTTHRLLKRIDQLEF